MTDKELLDWFYSEKVQYTIINTSNTKLNDGDLVLMTPPTNHDDYTENDICKNCKLLNSRVSKSVYCSDKCKLDHWKKNVQ